MSTYISSSVFQLPGNWTLAYAGVELGSSLAILDENVRAFHSSRGALDFSRDVAARKGRLRETSNEAQFTDFRFGGCVRSNINCVDSGADDIVLRLRKRVSKQFDRLEVLKVPSTTGEHPTYNGARSDSHDCDSSVDNIRADGSRSYRTQQPFRNFECTGGIEREPYQVRSSNG